MKAAYLQSSRQGEGVCSVPPITPDVDVELQFLFLGDLCAFLLLELLDSQHSHLVVLEGGV